MLELWLVRHAESLGNRDGSGSDSALTAEGRVQARGLGLTLASMSFDRVVSSPLLRARETIGLALPSASVEIEPRLRELVVPPERFIDVSRLGPELLRELLASVVAEPEAETGKAFMARVREWLAELPGEGRIVVVTHFAVIREIVRAWGGVAPQGIEPASMTLVRG